MFHTSTFLQCLHVIWCSEYGCMSWLSCNEVEVVVVAWTLTAWRDGVSTVWAFVYVTPLETVGVTARRDGSWVRDHWSRWTFNNEYWTLSALQPGKMATKEETTVWNRVSTFVYALPVDIVGAPARRNGCRARDHWSRQKFNIEYWTLDIVGLTAWQDGCQRRDHCSRQGFNISCRKKN